MKNKRILALILAIFMFSSLLSGCFQCKHENYSNGVCEKCGIECTHTYASGVCTVCGEPCKHNYKDSVCTVCNKTCEHNYLNGACTVCDKPCVHNYVDGTCTVCTKKCPHNFVNGFCSICDKPCTHDYEDGVCSVCNAICDHDYVNSVCRVCGLNCSHDYVDGVCKYCQLEDPDYIPADGGASLYKEIVDKFKELAAYKLSTGELPEIDENNKPFYLEALYEILSFNDITDKLGYAYTDVNGDGYVEFLITEANSRLYALFTLVEKTPVLVETFQNGLGYLMADGTVFYSIKVMDSVLDINGDPSPMAVAVEFHVTKMEGAKLVGFAYGHYDPDFEYDTKDDEVYFYLDDEGREVTVTFDEYKVFSNKYQLMWEAPSRFTRLCGFRYYSVFDNAVLGNKIAAFYDYELIIDTFTAMAANIATDKYAKTHWTGGILDDKMIYLTDEDYYIYNSINAGLVLLQKSDNPVFGYALKDLNKDGTEELLLLDNAYNLFAIFTTVDGNAVLLDSYHEWHTAFIDANGYIHVQDTVFPGRIKDRKYSVYEVAGDKLSLKSSIYLTHDLTSILGKPNGWYKAVNGEMVAIEESEYETLYQAFVGDLGSSTYNEYNQANAGLTFVSVMQE